MYKKNEELTLTITDMGNEGEGIGRADGFPFFVKGAIPGDVVRVGVTKVKKSYAYARLIEIIEASADRITPVCPHFGSCGGCTLMHMRYDAQLAYKEKKVREALRRIGGVDMEAAEMIAAERTIRYRNKEQYPFAQQGRDILCGFYAERSHRIVPQSDCLLGAAENEEILGKILYWMKKYDIPAYDEERHSGIIRHVLLRKAYASGQLMVCPVINAKELPQAQELCGSLSRIPGVHSVCVSVNRERTNVIMGDEIKCLWGEPYIEDTLSCDDGSSLRFRISPLSFYQVNPQQTKKLYSAALQYAGLDGSQVVWDLYCGIGTISLFLAGRAKRVYGVEVVERAIEDARENAVLNGIENAEFICGSAEEAAPRLLQLARPDVVVVDPPRKGLAASCVDTILKAAPSRIVYVSCDPATLARDIKLFTAGGYSLKEYKVCDMFPQSRHVETVVSLSLKSDSPKIEVSMKPGEDSLYEPKDKGTYEKIKAYVLEKYGLKVSSLYIAQVKDKCGLDKRLNYNLSKKEDPHVPECPKEKEDAIMDAFRHFGLIK